MQDAVEPEILGDARVEEDAGTRGELLVRSPQDKQYLDPREEAEPGDGVAGLDAGQRYPQGPRAPIAATRRPPRK